jgi:hypothetical protein
MATSKETVLESLPVDTALLESANRWFDISWYGLIVAGAITALAAFATVVFLFLQFWSSGVRERHTEWRTSTLELETETAKAALGKANAEIANANATAAAANERAAALEKEAAQARAEQERLKVQLAWRRITKEQHDNLVLILRPHKMAIRARYVAPDPEASQFAKEIIQTLKDAGAIVQEFLELKAPFPLGVIVGKTADGRSDLLASAFQGAGIATTIGESPLNNPKNEVDIFIGSKPPLF